MVDKHLNWQRYVLLIKFHWRFLLMCLAGGLVFGLILNLLILHPTFSSHGKLLIKGGSTPTYVTQLENDQEVRALTTNGNPLLTQIEVLNSQQLAEQVIARMKSTVGPKKLKEYQQRFEDFFNPESLAQIVSLKNPASTDVITLKVGTLDRDFSQLVVDNYMNAYRDFLEGINRESLHQRGHYIQEQIAVTEAKLKDVRRQLMSFREANNTVDLPNEAAVNIQQISDLESQRISLDSQISAKQGTVNRLRHLLGMSSSQGIRSVALGMNSNLADTQKALNAAMQEYQTLSVKYTDENPTMQALKTKIDEIRSQMAKETKQTVGSGGNIQNKIADPVRTNMVGELAAAEADLQGLRAQRAALAADLGRVKSRIQRLPAKQFQISELQDTERVLSDMVNMLRQKAAEAQFQASDQLSNVVVIQSATRPIKADFPRPKHVLFLMGFLGLLGGLGWLVALEWYRIQALKPMKEQFEEEPSREVPMYST